MKIKESQLRKVISESVQRVIKEYQENGYFENEGSAIYNPCQRIPRLSLAIKRGIAPQELCNDFNIVSTESGHNGFDPNSGPWSDNENITYGGDYEKLNELINQIQNEALKNELKTDLEEFCMDIEANDEIDLEPDPDRYYDERD